MKQIKNIKNKLALGVKNFWASESAQGMTEYILLVVVIIALAAVFRNSIRSAVSDKMDSVKGQITGFSGDGQ